MSDITLGLIVGFLGVVVMFGGLFWSRNQRMKATDPTDPEEINVGITSAKLILTGGSRGADLTVLGQRTEIDGQKYAFTSELLFNDAILGQWITVDDGRIVNRDAVLWVTDRATKEFYL